MKNTMKGGDHYERISDGRRGVWRGVTYGDGAAELHDLDTGQRFKARQDDLTLIDPPPKGPQMKLTPTSLAFFLTLAKDAPNWSGQPLVDVSSPALKGNLSDLKKKGLVTTVTDGGNAWVNFTEAGKALATEHGISLQ